MDNFSSEPTDKDVAEIIRLTPAKTPSESLQTIERAERYEMHPDEYQSMEKQLNPEAEIEERVPANVSAPIKNYMGKSANHANAIKDEVGVLETIADQARHVWYNLTEKQDLESEIQELNNRDRTSEKGLEEHEYKYLDQLYEAQREEIDSFGLTENEQIPGQVAGVINDMVRAVGNNKKLVAAGAAVGFFTPLPGGAAAGAGYGVTAAMSWDAYNRITDSTYGELRRMKDEKGEPLNLSRDTMDNIAMSVGVVSGALEAVTGHVLTGGLKKLTGKRALTDIVKNTALRARLDALGAVTKTAIASGGEEVSSELVAIVGENFAQGSNDEAGLINALSKTYEDVTTKPEIRKRLGMTALVGAAAGGTISGATSALSLGKAKKQLDLSNEEILKNRQKSNTINEAMKTLTSQEDFMSIAKTSVETEIKTNSPQELTQLRKEMFRDAGYEGKIFFSNEDVDIIAESNPELAAKLKTLDVTESVKAETNAPIGIEPHDFLDLVEEAPSISEYSRMNPDAPNPLESKNILEALNEAQTKRQEIFSSLGVNEELSPEQIATLEGLDAAVDETINTRGVTEYIDENQTFTEAVEAIIPPKEAARFNESQLKVREAVANELVEDFNVREQRIENKIVKANEKIDKELQLKKYKKDLEVVEKFKAPPKGKGSEGHKRAGHSPLAIDPASLPENLREAYLADPKLQKRKVFVEGGLTADDAAALSGFDTSEDLLKTLANAPTRAELLAMRKKKAAEIRKQVKESRDITRNERLDKAFDDLSMLHREEMKLMKVKEWPSTKLGVRKITLKLPEVLEMNNKAKGIVRRTKVGNISPKQYARGEKTLQRKAVSHILKNEVEQAFMSKEKAMLNSELTRESLRAKKQVDSAREFVKKLTSKKGMDNLKSARLDKKANELLDLFNLGKTSEAKGIKQDNYFQYLQKLESQNKSIVVPESLVDIRERGEDLTVEQYLRITDRLKTLNHQAKLKNRLLKRNEKRAKANKISSIEAVAVDAVEDLISHPTYDATPDEVLNTNSKNFRHSVSEKYQFGSSLFTNLKNVATELDREALGGQHYENLAQPMVNAENVKRSKTLHVVNQIKKISEDYNSKDFTAAFNDFKHVPEFEGYAELGNGKVSKADLWRLFSYLGDSTAKERFKNFKNTKGEPMTVEKIKTVLETHLEHRDAKLAQNFTNIFKSFEQEAFDLHTRTTGIEPTMVKGAPIEFKGKMYDGGYVPLDYLNTSPEEKVNRYIEALGEKETSMFGDSQASMYGRLRAAEMTDQGRLVDRTGSSKPLDIDFRTFLHAYEEHTHDIAYREAGIDTLKLLKNEAYAKAIIATVGKPKYELMGKAIVETVGKPQEDALHPFSKEKTAANNIVKYIESGFSVGVLGFKASSVAMQGLSLGPASLRMGPKGGRYIAKAIGKMIVNLHKFNDIYQEAARINPDLIFNKDSIDDTLVSSTFDFIPETKNRGKVLNTLTTFKNKFAETSMLGLQKLDVYIKASVSLAANAQFLAGDVKNFPLEKLNKMTELERQAASQKYVKQVADLALTTSATIDKNSFEKVAVLKLFSKFYTDSRSQFNTATSQIRKIRNEGIKAQENFSEGNKVEGYKNLKEAAVNGTSLMSVYVLSKLYTDSLYDEETPLTELERVNDMSSLGEWIENSAGYAAAAPVQGLVATVPVARDFQFALGSTSAKKRVSNPLVSALSSTVMGISGLVDYLDGYDLRDDQKKGLLMSMSIATGGIPVQGPLKIQEYIEESEIAGGIAQFTKRELGRLGAGIKKFIDNHGDEPDQQEFIEELKQIQKEIIPPEDQNIEDIMPEGINEAMKINKWQDLNSETGAVGVYQFTQERWDEIAEADPTLGLTDNGRFSKDLAQQEKAIKWSNENNAQNLLNYNLEVNSENLLGAHRFGVDDYATVLMSEDSDKISDIVENEKLFQGFSTVKEVKSYIKKNTKHIDEQLLIKDN